MPTLTLPPYTLPFPSSTFSFVFGTPHLLTHHIVYLLCLLFSVSLPSLKRPSPHENKSLRGWSFLLILFTNVIQGPGAVPDS